MVLFLCCRSFIVLNSQGNEWFISQSCRLTYHSGTLEERCIIHIVDWSLFCTSGVRQEKVESTLRCAQPSSWEICILCFNFWNAKFHFEFISSSCVHYRRTSCWDCNEVAISHFDITNALRKAAVSQRAERDSSTCVCSFLLVDSCSRSTQIRTTQVET